MKNEWLENEINILKKERKQQKKRGDELMPFLMSLAIILLIATSSMYAQSSFSPTPHEYAGFFPSTWTCPNKSCRYENYDGIDHCAICGSRRR